MSQYQQIAKFITDLSEISQRLVGATVDSTEHLLGGSEGLDQAWREQLAAARKAVSESLALQSALINDAKQQTDGQESLLDIPMAALQANLDLREQWWAAWFDLAEKVDLRAVNTGTKTGYGSPTSVLSFWPWTRAAEERLTTQPLAASAPRTASKATPRPA